MENEKQIDTLNSLITTTIDSVTGYEDAAENVESQNLRQVFRENADDRSQAADTLRAEVRRLGGDPETSGSLAGKTHQRFLDLKAAITGRDEKAIVNEVERGEDYLKGKFEEALKDGDLTGSARTVVEQAYQSVRRGHDQISALKHGMDASA